MKLEAVSGRRGQAAVETALVMPLTIFMLLGIMQVALLTQARAMAKYAAYRAARAGAMHNACKDPMVHAAMAALVPVTALHDRMLQANSGASFLVSYQLLKSTNRYLGPGVLAGDIVDVRICGPLESYFQAGETPGVDGSTNEFDFDDPQINIAASVSSGETTGAKLLRGFERTKLKVQVKFNYRMTIPFADAVIHRIWLGERASRSLFLTDKTDTVKDSIGSGGNQPVKLGRPPPAESTGALRTAARAGAYVIPIYASYSLRMHSNFFLDRCPLPQENVCFHYGSTAESKN